VNMADILSMGRREVAWALILDRKGRLLLHLRDNKPEIRYPGCWSLIGGGIEEGESPQAAVLRELREELGADFGKEHIVQLKELNPDGIKRYVFLVETRQKKFKLGEGQRFGWFSLARAYRLNMHPIVKKMLKEMYGQKQKTKENQNF
jgi:8-oxo-dGTP diphosphatase